MQPENIDDARPRSNGFFRFIGSWLKMVGIYYFATVITTPAVWANQIGNAFWIGLVFALPAKLIGDTMRQFGRTVLFNADTAFMVLYVSFFAIWGVVSQTPNWNVGLHAFVYFLIQLIAIPVLIPKRRN